MGARRAHRRARRDLRHPRPHDGLVTIAEASAICAIYLVFVEVVVYRDIKLFSKDPAVPTLSRVIREAMVMVGAILIILGVALA